MKRPLSRSERDALGIPARRSTARKLSRSEVLAIRVRLAERESTVSIARRYAVSWETVRRIQDGETYADY